MEKAVCFSGHREDRLPGGAELERLEQSIYNEIARAVDDGFTRFIHGACHGFDIVAAMQVIKYRRDTGSKVLLVAAIPFPGQSHGKNEEQQMNYSYVMRNSEVKEIICSSYNKEAFFLRNRWMCEHAQRLICYYDGQRSGTMNTVNNARRLGLEIINLYK